MDQYHPRYERFLETIMPPVKKRDLGTTFISHHTLLQRDVLAHMMRNIENRHGHPFWHSFQYFGRFDGRPSEYELYARYSLAFFPHRTKVRDLKFQESGDCLYNAPDIYYVACQNYLRENRAAEAAATAAAANNVKSVRGPLP